MYSHGFLLIFMADTDTDHAYSKAQNLDKSDKEHMADICCIPGISCIVTA